MVAVWVAACSGDSFNATSGSPKGGAGAAGSGSTAKGGSSAGSSPSGGASAQGGNAGSGDAASAGSAGAPLGPPCTTDADCNSDPSNHCAGSQVCSPTPNGAVCVVVSSPVDVDDHNLCTVDACDPKTGSVTHDPVPVGDGDPCTIDTCDPYTGVAHTKKGDACAGCIADEDCNDDDPCTKDRCGDAGKCTHALREAGSTCKTETACVNASTCSESGACVAGAAKDISDGDACTFDRCVGGQVVHEPPAPPADKCTISVCDPKTGVTATRSAADDGTACTADACDPSTGVVTHTTITVLDDNDPCTKDACDPTTGNVSHTAIPNCTGCATDSDCDDKLPCTKDTCTAGQCSHDNLPPKTSCSNNLSCDGEELCDANGGCQPGIPPAQDDGDACTIDSCNEMTGVTHTPVNPDDGKPCTDDVCDPKTGVSNTPRMDCASCTTAADCGTLLPSACQSVTCDGGICAKKAAPEGTSCGLLGGVGCGSNVCSANGVCQPAMPVDDTACKGRCGTVKTSCGVVECPNNCPNGTCTNGYCQ